MPSPAQALGYWVRIELGAWLSVRVSSVFVLPGVGNGLAAGLIPRPKNPTNCLLDPQYLLGKGPDGLIRKAVEEEEKEKEEEEVFSPFLTLRYVVNANSPSFILST
jgi:hypothetical protein